MCELATTIATEKSEVTKAYVRQANANRDEDELADGGSGGK